MSPKEVEMEILDSPTSPDPDPSDDTAVTDNLILKRKGGSSIIDYRPLFSADGETLYIIWKNVIRAFSTKTGDFVREFEHAEHRIIGISLCSKYENTVIGCTERGEMISWNTQTGLIKRVLELEISSESVKIKTFHVVYCSTQETIVLVSYLLEEEEKKTINLQSFNIIDGSTANHFFTKKYTDEYYVDIIGNYGQNLIVLAQETSINIIQSTNLNRLRYLRTGRKITCIAGHPDEECLATGDTSGRVLIWKDLSNSRQGNHATYHWHTLPVTEVAFSTSGGHMYSGGGECVLVKWVISNPNNKSFLPRLPAPIRHLTIAPENMYVAVSTLDNGITITDPQKKLTSVIQNFTWGVTRSLAALFPAGLTVDPRTNSLVLNSRTGHIQFYNTHTKSLLYNVNITAQNLLTQERSMVIVNTEVTKIALNHSGLWMATVEERDDKISSTEIRLKFWQFNIEKQMFTLNTSIELPHDVGVNALQFQTNNSLDESSDFAVTTGRDKKFKLWNLVSPTSIYKKTKHWQCHSVGYYRDLAATDAAFSEDGSLLGVAFDSTLTLWNPETMELKKALSYFMYKEKIMQIAFGKYETRHLVVVGSAVHIAVWDLLTLRIKWSVPLKFSTLASDPFSSNMAVFTTDNTLFVFKPSHSKPVYTRKNIIENNSSIHCASFVPHLQEDSSFDDWQKKSQLYFLDSNQELLTLEPESKSEAMLNSLIASSNLPVTAFGRLLASKTVSSKDPIAPFIHEYLGVSGKGIVEELLSIPAHTLPPMMMLCTPFILSLMAQTPDKTSSIGSPDPEKMVEDSTILIDLAGDEDKKPATDKKPVQVHSDMKEEEKELSGSRFVEHDWSFLLSGR